MKTEEYRNRMRLALGVPVEDDVTAREPTKELQNIKRIEANTYSNRTQGIRINKNCIYVSREVADLLGGGGGRVYLWVAEYNGQNVLLMRASQNKLTQNYKMSSIKGYERAYRMGTATLVNRMMAAGLPLGRYVVSRAKGGVVAIPEGVKT